jgi:hypothetical protein
MNFNDTPITRVSILEMPVDQLQEFVEHLQERRLKSYNIYMAAQEIKQEKLAGNQAEQLSKRLTQFISKHETVLKGLSALEKYASEIVGLRLALGHSPQDILKPTTPPKT